MGVGCKIWGLGGDLSVDPPAGNNLVLVPMAGADFRLIDSGITQLKVQGPPRTCNERKEEQKSTSLKDPPRSPRVLTALNLK